MANIEIKKSVHAGYFEVDGIEYPKGHFAVKYDTLGGLESDRNFTLYNIYSKANLIASRGYNEIVGVNSWDELMALLMEVGALSGSSADGAISSLRTPFYQFFDTIGDGSGSSLQNVDGSVSEVSFKITPPSDKVYGIARVIFSLKDSGSMDSGGWGNRANPLVNGIKVIWHRAGQAIDLTKTPIRSHIDIAAICYDINHNEWGQGDEFVVARFTFTKAGQFLELDGSQGDYLELLVRDDLTYLVEQKLSCQGYQI